MARGQCSLGVVRPPPATPSGLGVKGMTFVTGLWTQAADTQSKCTPQQRYPKEII